MAMKSLLEWVFIKSGWWLMKNFVTVFLPLLIVNWIGRVISDFNMLTVVYWNGRPFNHYLSLENKLNTHNA